MVGLSVLRFELDLVLYVVIWTQCSLFLFGLDVHCFGLSMPAHFEAIQDTNYKDIVYIQIWRFLTFI